MLSGPAAFDGSRSCRSLVIAEAYKSISGIWRFVNTRQIIFCQVQKQNWNNHLKSLLGLRCTNFHSYVKEEYQCDQILMIIPVELLAFAIFIRGMNKLIHVLDKGTSSFPLHNLLYISKPIPIICWVSWSCPVVVSLLAPPKLFNIARLLWRILDRMCLSIMSNKL